MVWSVTWPAWRCLNGVMPLTFRWFGLFLMSSVFVRSVCFVFCVWVCVFFFFLFFSIFEGFLERIYEAPLLV